MSWFFKEAQHAQLYLKYRPSYPKEVYEAICKFLAEGENVSRWRTAVDIGCGTGQSTLPLCDRFDNVIGVDQSVAQIDEANASLKDDLKTKITYRVSVAHDLPFLEDGKTDLVTTAQALHWFDGERFYREVLRVLRPGGVLAAYGYGIPEILNPEAQHILLEFYRQKLDGYWEKGREHIDDLYSDLYKSFAQAFPVCKRDDYVVVKQQFTIDEFIGYLRTWSGYQHYRQKNPNEADPLEFVKARFATVFGEAVAEQPMHVTWPVFILLGRKAF